jgi:hypothetical protein
MPLAIYRLLDIPSPGRIPVKAGKMPPKGGLSCASAPTAKEERLQRWQKLPRLQ